MSPGARADAATLQAAARTLVRESAVLVRDKATRGEADLNALHAAFRLSPTLAADAPSEKNHYAAYIALARLRDELIAARSMPGLARNTLAEREINSTLGRPVQELELRLRRADRGEQSELSPLEAELLAQVCDEPQFAIVAKQVAATLVHEANAAEEASEQTTQPRTAEQTSRPPAMASRAPGDPSEERPDADAIRWSEYRVFTHEFDEEVHIRQLYSSAELRQLRRKLATESAPARIEIENAFRRLDRLLANERSGRWLFEQPDGVLDGSRLARVVASPRSELPFKRDEVHQGPRIALTLLIDTSRSLAGTSIALAAVALDVMVRSLERAGVQVEVLGFTTKDWDGGEAHARWQKRGRPSLPGRLSALRHIVFKAAHEPYQKVRDSLGALFDNELLKENIDGEALLWARERLCRAQADKRVLLLLTDGAPSCEATRKANYAGYLDAHLDEALSIIAADRAMEFVALGLGSDLGQRYPAAIQLRAMDELSHALPAVLDDCLSLNGQRRRSR